MKTLSEMTFVGASLLAIAMCGTAAKAQTGASGGSAESADDASGDAIIVTARRRDERLLDVPLAVTAIAGETLERAAVSDVADLAKIAPGFTVQTSAFGPALLTPSIRGQRPGLPNIVFDASVNVYFAEVVQARAQGLNTALYDLDSVQVLRGPQGTLFGRNSTGGALLISPAAPKYELSGYGKVSVGNYDLRHFEGALNMPLAEGLALRVAGQLTRRDGYVKSLATGKRLDNERSEGLRASLRIEPLGSNFSTDIVLDWVHRNDAAVAYRMEYLNPVGFTKFLAPQFAAQQNAGFHTTYSEAPDKGGTKIDNLSLSVISKYEFDNGITIKNVFGYKKVNSFFYIDFDAVETKVVESEETVNTDQYSDELQISGKAMNDNLDWIFGGYYFTEQGDDVQVTTAFFVPTYDLRSAKNRSVSVFGQATYRLPGLEDVSITLGARNTWDSRQLGTTSKFIGSNACRLFDANENGNPLSPCFREGTAKFSKLTYIASVDYKPSRDWLVYLKLATGYRTGGFPGGPKIPRDFIPYRPEEVTEYEFGLKGAYNLVGGPARTNIAVYYDDFKDIQRLLAYFIGTQFVNEYVNAAKGKVKGFEFEQYWQPVQGLELNFSYAYTDAKYDSFLVAKTGGDYTASPFAGVSKHTLTGSIRYGQEIGSAGDEIAAQVSGSYRSKSLGSDVTGFSLVTQKPYPQTVVPGYETFDGRLEWNHIAGSAFSAALWVRNFTDKKYYTGFPMDWGLLGFSTGFVGAPRAYGVEVSSRF